MTKLWAILTNHKCAWGVIHMRVRDNKLIQTCYSCSKEITVKVELRPQDVSIQFHKK